MGGWECTEQQKRARTNKRTPIRIILFLFYFNDVRGSRCAKEERVNRCRRRRRRVHSRTKCLVRTGSRPRPARRRFIYEVRSISSHTRTFYLLRTHSIVCVRGYILYIICCIQYLQIRYARLLFPFDTAVRTSCCGPRGRLAVVVARARSFSRHLFYDRRRR